MLLEAALMVEGGKEGRSGVGGRVVRPCAGGGQRRGARERQNEALITGEACGDVWVTSANYRAAPRPK